MSKVAVVYWSGTGNTEEMANKVAEGAKAAGAEVEVISADDFEGTDISSFDGVAFGCPAMGAEELEDGTVEPFVSELEGFASGKKVALFGSYDWGDGEWMRTWAERMEQAGAQIVGGEGLICHGTPGADAIDECESLGREVAGL